MRVEKIKTNMIYCLEAKMKKHKNASLSREDYIDDWGDLQSDFQIQYWGWSKTSPGMEWCYIDFEQAWGVEIWIEKNGYKMPNKNNAV